MAVLLMTASLCCADQDVPDQYKPKSLSWINWDCPATAHPGIDVDYRLTGYDWHNRSLRWTLLSGPDGMTVDHDGTIHWTPPTDGAVENVSVRLVIGDNEAMVDKQFVIRVDSKRCFFVAPENQGDDAGDGTLQRPFATIDAAIQRIVELKDEGGVVYLRGGTYSTQWAWYRSEKHLRKMAELDFSADRPCMFRNYPGETVRHSLGEGHGWRFYGEHIILYGLEVEGGATTEVAGVLLYHNSVGKDLVVHGYHARQNGNCTGFKIGAGVVLDRCLAYDNYDRNDPTFHNSSNYLFYGTSGSSNPGDAFIIDSVSRGYSPVGYKIKHAGATARLHLHRSVGVGTLRIFAGADNFSSIRHCLFYADDPKSLNTVALGITDPKTKGEVNLDLGMLIESCALLKGAGEDDSPAVTIWSYCCGADPQQPAIFRNNIIYQAAHRDESTGRKSLFSAHARKEPPQTFTVRFIGNQWWTDAPHSIARIGTGDPMSIDDVNGYGQSRDNAQYAGVPTIDLDIAGARWTFADDRLQHRKGDETALTRPESKDLPLKTAPRNAVSKATAN